MLLAFIEFYDIYNKEFLNIGIAKGVVQQKMYPTRSLAATS